MASRNPFPTDGENEFCDETTVAKSTRAAIMMRVASMHARMGERARGGAGAYGVAHAAWMM